MIVAAIERGPRPAGIRAPLQIDALNLVHHEGVEPVAVS